MTDPKRSTKPNADDADRVTPLSASSSKASRLTAREPMSPAIDHHSRAFMTEYFNKYLESDLDELNVENFKKCLKEIGWLDRYVADSSPKVDVLRVNKELEGATGSEMIKSRFDSLLSNKGNSLLFTSAKNMVFAMRWLFFTNSEKEQGRTWVRNNAEVSYKSPPPLNTSNMQLHWVH